MAQNEVRLVVRTGMKPVDGIQFYLLESFKILLTHTEWWDHLCQTHLWDNYICQSAINLIDLGESILEEENQQSDGEMQTFTSPSWTGSTH